MSSLISPGLIKRYFAGDCSAAEELLVESWMQANPENTQQALQWLENSTSIEDSRVVQQVLSAENEVWNNTAERLRSGEGQNISRPVKMALRTRKNPILWFLNQPFSKYTAIVIGFILVASAGYLYKQNQLVLVAVDYGQVKHITLPDHSKVVINGNSTLSYKPNWQNNTREVWLSGEAFFKVRHQKNHHKFVVHLSNKLEVEVLGTEFNVQDRPQNSNVVLKTGKVKLNLNQKLKNSSVYLRPGELIEVKQKNNLPQITRKEMVNTEQYYSWTHHKWILEATSLQEMLQKVKETYGINTIIKNKELLQRKASGSIPLPTNKPDLLLQDIALLFELTVNKKGDVVYLEDKRF